MATFAMSMSHLVMSFKDIDIGISNDVKAQEILKMLDRSSLHWLWKRPKFKQEICFIDSKRKNKLERKKHVYPFQIEVG